MLQKLLLIKDTKIEHIFELADAPPLMYTPISPDWYNKFNTFDQLPNEAIRVTKRQWSRVAKLSTGEWLYQFDGEN